MDNDNGQLSSQVKYLITDKHICVLQREMGTYGSFSMSLFHLWRILVLMVGLCFWILMVGFCGTYGRFCVF